MKFTKQYIENLDYYTLPNPEKTGLVFNNWLDLDGDGGIINTNNQVPVGGIVLYADWSDFVETYTVIFNPNGGSPVSQNTRQVKDGEPIGELPTSTKDGYVLAGWFTEPVGGIPITKDTPITSDQTFYAHWVDNTITTITFRDNIPITVTFDNNID